MYNFIYSIFAIYFYIFDSVDFGSFGLSDDAGNFMSIETNLYNYFSGGPTYVDVGGSLAFNFAMICTIITLILLLYMVYKICKLIITRISGC